MKAELFSLRECRVCKATRPLAHEFFEATGSGYRHVCRDCRRARHREWAAQNRERAASSTKAWIAANRERYERYHAEYRQKNRAALKQQNKEWRARNAAYIAQYRRRQREEHPEKIAKQQAANHLKHRAERRAKQNAYYAATAEQRRARYTEYREQNREAVNERQRAFYRKNRYLFKAHAAKRRARQLRATPAWFGEIDDFAMKEAYRVARARERVTGFKWHVDHIVPLRGRTVCGLHVHNNVRVIPAIVNLKKGNRHA